MTFNDYIKYTGIIILYVDYTASSTKTLNEVKDIVIDRVNRVAEASNIDVKCYLTDHHNGNKYVVYSQSMLDKYEVLTEQFVLDLDMEAINNMLNEAYTIQKQQQINTITKYEKLDKIECIVNSLDIEISIDKNNIDSKILKRSIECVL
jgi:hypothetical protein